MKNYIYLIYNTLSKRYDSSVSFPSDEYAAVYAPRLMRNPSECELVKVGSYSVESGIIESLDPVRIPLKSESVVPIENLETK